MKNGTIPVMPKKASLLTLTKFYYRPYPWFVFGVIMVGVGFVAFETICTTVVYPMMSSLVNVTEPEVEKFPWVSFLQSIHGFNDTSRAVILVFIFAGSYIILNVFDYGRRVITDVFARVITQDFQYRIFQKYIRSDFGYFHNKKQGTILFRIITAPQYMTLIFSSLPKLVVDLIKIIAIGGVLFFISFELTLLLAGLSIIFYLGMKLVSNRLVYRYSQLSQAVHEEQNVVANESITGIREVKITQTEEAWINKFGQRVRALCRLYIKNDCIRAFPTPGLQIVFLLAFVLIGFWNLRGNPQGLIAYLPIAGAYFYSFMRLLPALTEISSTKLMIAERTPYAEAVYQELQSSSRKIADGHMVLDQFLKEIRFEMVSFSYPDRKSTLSQINIVFPKGQTTALVGASGSGKSTITDLIVGLFEPDQGRVLIDGHDLRELRRASWLNKIGYVSQDSFIFNASVRDNIIFGTEQVEIEDVIEAARSAGAHEFIMELPEKYETLLGDRGVKLSGGQRQRIAIARALLHHPSILIFDEATSNLDSFSEQEVQASINKIAKDHTIILIAHRLSTVTQAHKIIVLDKGRVVEEGAQCELLKKEGVYYGLYNTQRQDIAVAN